ncbi:hypothetical protein BKA82DRAFT_539490 [Pisolithus tinctorius]|uniref:Uncharacterized protein n=1 Tax=Pisolithus tinctorius Marx 270 TaxID=870435 RepID=A0A0C3K5B2_PISTI|nr:hypothetical protein BKA82DRAFT_539490 [Pisolithus tinctorius]KIO04762.1 hypothetical protein M404DRAFT_539490 [Pisolithus tinctorius Marx 270]
MQGRVIDTLGSHYHWKSNRMAHAIAASQEILEMLKSFWIASNACWVQRCDGATRVDNEARNTVQRASADPRSSERKTCCRDVLQHFCTFNWFYCMTDLFVPPTYCMTNFRTADFTFCVNVVSGVLLPTCCSSVPSAAPRRNAKSTCPFGNTIGSLVSHTLCSLHTITIHSPSGHPWTRLAEITIRASSLTKQLLYNCIC